MGTLRHHCFLCLLGSPPLPISTLLLTNAHLFLEANAILKNVLFGLSCLFPFIFAPVAVLTSGGYFVVAIVKGSERLPAATAAVTLAALKISVSTMVRFEAQMATLVVTVFVFSFLAAVVLAFEFSLFWTIGGPDNLFRNVIAIDLLIFRFLKRMRLKIDFELLWKYN